MKFCTFKAFKPVKIKLKVVSKCRACPLMFYCILFIIKCIYHKIIQPCQNNLQTFSWNWAFLKRLRSNIKTETTQRSKKKCGSFSLWWMVFLWFSVKSLEIKVWILSSFKEVVFIFWFCLFSYYIILRSSDFSVTGIKNTYCSVVDYIFSLTFCVGNSEVYWICICVLFGHQSVIVFCFVFHRKSAA